VRQPVLSDDDIANAFDNITYNKGSALLNMFESYIARKVSERDRRFLHKYEWGNATSAQFLELWAAAIRLWAADFDILDQAGVPLVTARLQCDGGSAKLQLSQQRFLPRAHRAQPARAGTSRSASGIRRLRRAAILHFDD